MGMYQERLRRFNSRTEWKRAMQSALSMVPKAPHTVLDLGCGIGSLVSIMATKWPHSVISGIDIDPESVREAKRVPIRSGISFREEGSVHGLGVYDLVTCMFVIGHIKDPHEAIMSIRKSLVHGGSLLIAVPNQRFDDWMRPWNLVTGYKDDPTLIHRWTPKGFLVWLEAYGMRVDSVQYHGDNVKWLPYTPNSLKSWMFVRAVKK